MPVSVLLVPKHHFLPLQEQELHNKNLTEYKDLCQKLSSTLEVRQT
jgi:hypothetical protein